LIELTGLEPMVPDDPAWYGCMAHAPLPPPAGKAASLKHDPIAGPTAARSLQRALWQQCKIEVPVVEFRDRRFIRISCHLYNDTAQTDRLTQALGDLLQRGY
jgi:isopenicillin-N epimerase